MGTAIVCFGEAMIEVTRQAVSAAHVAFGGDTLNTAIYMARLGVPVAYMTALGTDPWSGKLRTAWAREGVDLSLVTTHPTRVPGLYEISTSADGERSFVYRRDTSAARAFFNTDGADAALKQAVDCELLVLSGVTLAIFTPEERSRIVALAQAVRGRGGKVAFDPNWRARLWTTSDEFRAAVLSLAPFVSVALPSFDDEASVWGDASPDATLTRWHALGVGEVVVKDGAAGVVTAEGRIIEPPVRARDTTGAGDSFNGGYLACRLAGLPVHDSARFGAKLAACVVMHPGAIMPSDQMPPLPAGLTP